MIRALELADIMSFRCEESGRTQALDLVKWGACQGIWSAQCVAGFVSLCGVRRRFCLQLVFSHAGRPGGDNDNLL